MKTILHKTFVRDLKKINDKTLLAKVAEIIQEVEAAKGLNEIANLKKLTGYTYAYQFELATTGSAFTVNQRLCPLFVSNTAKISIAIFHDVVWRRAHDPPTNPPPHQ
jgi:hypothetical protein